MVGVNTVIADDPQLTVRLNGKKIERLPLRVVIDSSGRIPEKSALFLEKGTTFVASTQDLKLPDNLQNVTTKAFPSKEARVDLTSVFKYLGNIPVSSNNARRNKSHHLIY
jgi:diaminohydroxyphosphoribosylaminopyrimidine deaminase/5-amino-6-(5-phosphoribosylamino)uracil reductase